MKRLIMLTVLLFLLFMSVTSAYAAGTLGSGEAGAYIIPGGGDNGGEEDQYILSIEIEGQGTTTPAAGDHTYPGGTEATLAATPFAGWEFQEWVIGGTGVTEAENTVTLDGNKTATACFVEKAVINLAATVEGRGTADPQVVLTWDPLEGASSYKVYRKVVLAPEDCFIATAAYGSSLAPAVAVLRQFRDTYLLNSKVGAFLVGQYYRHSPSWAGAISQSEVLKGLSRLALLPFTCLASLALNWSLALAGAVFILFWALLMGGRRRRGRDVTVFLLILMALGALAAPALAVVQGQAGPTGGYDVIVTGISDTSFTDRGVTPGKTYEYMVSALSPGGREIAYSKTKSVEVSAAVPVTGVAIDQGKLVLTAGQSSRLTATVQPAGAANKEVTWSSSDTGIATVTDGTVTAVSAGTTTITATTVDGGYTATRIVEVAGGLPEGKDWRLVWHDEFDGAGLDTTKWFVEPTCEFSLPGMDTRPAPENLSLDGDGHLVVELTQDPCGTVGYYNGHIYSRFSKAYGYFEARVQFSREPGWWTALWLAGLPYDCGVDTFTSPQEFDIFEDFYKPKTVLGDDIQHCYHASIDLDLLEGEDVMLTSTRLWRTSSSHNVVGIEDYAGWHTVGFQWTPLEHIFYVDGEETFRQSYRDVPVTNVPLHLIISGIMGTPGDGDEDPFFGRLQEAQFPDRLNVDYVRVYEQETGAHTPPQVTLARQGDGPSREGEPVTFGVSATASGGSKIEKILLFSMGRLRAEQLDVDTTEAQVTFTVDNLFPRYTNTVVAMARDDKGLVGQSEPLRLELTTGREFTGTPWQGTPQAIPGTVQGGCYDEGGNGVAFRSNLLGPSDASLEYRKDELGALPEAVEVGGDRAQWISYEIEVAEAGYYEAELFMNRPDYSTRAFDPAGDHPEGTIRFNLGEPGDEGLPLLSWSLPALWNSGDGWRSPQRSLGKQTVHLPAGRHKLILFAGNVNIKFTFFCKLVLRKV